MHQSLLVKQLSAIFPNEQTLVNSRGLKELRDPVTHSVLELDVYLPNLFLGFEFQDEHHYVTTWYQQKSLDSVKFKDDTKQIGARKNGITLIIVPTWWDAHHLSLEASISFYRPDLLPFFSGAVPIPLNYPQDHFNPYNIPGVGGELMLASFEPNFEFQFRSNNWWLGEKYDGVRFCWNSNLNVAYTRTGKELNIHPKIVLSMPKIFVDGEFWFGRGNFLMSSVLVTGILEYIQWDLLRLMAFDVPSRDFHFQKFETRYSVLLSHIPLTSPFSIVVPRVKAISLALVKKTMQSIVNDEGEGVILRKVNSFYELGRTPSLIKLKSFYGDQEGIVVGKGRHNSVHVKLPNGSTFIVSSQNVFVSPPPSIGEIVTFSFENYVRRNIPVNPKIIRIRTDVTWQDVVRNSTKERERKQELVSQPLSEMTVKFMRLFLESVAKKRNMDPLLPDTWYNIPYEYVYQFKVGRKILKRFKGINRAVQHLFPDVKFVSTGFVQSSWYGVEMRRNFFEKYAKDNSFDPLVAENWYSQPRTKILYVKGAYRVISYHNNSVYRSLLDLFPDIGLQKSKFVSSNWTDPAKRKKFFERYAKEQNFDPLVADMWYMQPRKKIMLMKAAKNVIKYHKNSVSRALMELFPNIGLQKSKLWIKPAMSIEANRRKFFEIYANEQGFDPLNPERWYSQSRKKILEEKGAKKVVSYYNDNVTQALMDLFPDIGFDKLKFESRHCWDDSSFRRKFFESYAREHKFDPLVPQNWYNQPRLQIKEFKGSSGMFRYYNYNLSEALLDCFPEIGLDSSLFNWVSPSWQATVNRRNFFENYAKEKGFDPLDPNFWYSQARDKIISTKGGLRVLSYHGGSISNALLELFPEIGLDKLKLGIPPFSDLESRKKFFENYAKESNFDPQDAEKWYLQSKSDIITRKGASTVLAYHQNNLTTALLACFPDIGLEPLKFLWAQKPENWSSSRKRRSFFENYAAENLFNPLVPSNWYSQPKERIMAKKGAFSVVNFHQCSLVKSIISLFPEVIFDKSKFLFK